jgi:pyridoxal/pyridoxine/pyridoxamine kinase
VQFSNHTQYSKIEGQRLKANELEELFRGLKSNNLVEYTHLLTGDFLENLSEKQSHMILKYFQNKKNFIMKVMSEISRF